MPRKERERRYITEYMMSKYPDGQFQLNVELGQIPQDYIDRYGLNKAAAIFRPTRPRVDAIAWLPNAYLLIEAKVRDIKIGIGDLLFYRLLIPKTPDLPFYDGQPVKCLLVVPWSIDWVKAAAEASDVEIVVFKPDWIDEYVKERQHYFTAEYQAARSEKLRLREILGVD